VRSWNDDPFTKKARRENYAARSVYKLQEIDQREKILAGSRLILDLGASPGSWTQLCLERAPKARVVAVDLAPLRIEHPRLTFAQGNVEEIDILPLLGGEKADVVLSDMAPKTSGIAAADTARSLELAEMALGIARLHLKQDGAFVVKLFMGGEFEGFRRTLREAFEAVRLLRPETTRKHSREIFFIARNLRPASP